MPQIKKKSFIQKNGLIAVWTMAGFMAMGYIGFLATGTGTHNTPENQIAQLTANASMSPVRQEIAALREHVKELTSREKNTSRKLSLIEEALGPNTAALPDQQLVSRTNENVDLNAASANLPVKSAKVTINLLPLTQNDTTSEFTDTVQSKNFGVKIASALSISSLKRHWANLNKSNPGLIGNLKPHYIDKSTPDRPRFNLLAGPFAKLSDAKQHCHKLSKVSIECQETQFFPTSMKNFHTADNDATR